jgi:hypothetical protein
MKKEQLKQLIKEEIQKILQEKEEIRLDMKKIYNILKSNDMNPNILKGNKITGIELIEFGSYDAITGEDWGLLYVSPDGNINGQDNWGMWIKNEEEIMDALNTFRKDQSNSHSDKPNPWPYS